MEKKLKKLHYYIRKKDSVKEEFKTLRSVYTRLGLLARKSSYSRSIIKSMMEILIKIDTADTVCSMGYIEDFLRGVINFMPDFCKEYTTHLADKIKEYDEKIIAVMNDEDNDEDIKVDSQGEYWELDTETPRYKIEFKK